MRAPERKPVGRPKKLELQKLRAKLWYWDVQSREGLGNTALDRKFGLFYDETSPPPKIFESLRRRGTVPTKRPHTRRPADLVEAVGQAPGYEGTYELFHSPFWQLVEKPINDVVFVREILDRCLGNCGLARAPFGAHAGVEVTSEPVELYGKYYRSRLPERLWIYAVTLDRLLQRLPVSLDRLALVAALFKEAHLACDLELALYLKQLVEQEMDVYCEQLWIPDDVVLGLENCILGSLFYWQTHASLDACYELYEQEWPVIQVTRPLVPVRIKLDM